MYRKHDTSKADSDTGRRGNAFKRALLWVTAILVAVFPFPWW